LKQEVANVLKDWSEGLAEDYFICAPPVYGKRGGDIIPYLLILLETYMTSEKVRKR